MDLKRFATFIFNAFVWLAFMAMMIVFLRGIYKGVQSERKHEPEAVEYIEPVHIPESEELTAESEEIHTKTEEPYVVVLSYSFPEEADTERYDPSYTEEELEMLALVIYQEAGSDACSDTVRQMVGEVVLNRVADDRFPNTIEEVLLQERQYGMLHWTGLVWAERASDIAEAHAVQRAYDCAERVLCGERLLPDDVVWQAEFAQGSEVVAQQDGFYFCRG